MKFGKLFGLVFLWLGCGLMAHAQFGVYFGYSATDFSGIRCMDASSTSAPSLACANGVSNPVLGSGGAQTFNTGSVKPSGPTVGGYFDFRSVGPVRLGVDLRYMHDRSNKSAADSGGGQGATVANTVLAGVRGSVKTPYNWLRPYAEVAFGRTNSNLTEPSCLTNTGTTLLCSGASVNTPRQFDNFFRYEGFVGADIRIASMLDLRAIELGIGNMNRFGTGASANTTSSVGVQSIGAAIVFHLPR